ncbi:hypothetical protein [Bifidobacterium xylocopae]|uniref:hypothetical protein n=1 Tax=Bifidobacterium xylocopae TaxID=2493119 RepID=UPI001374E3A0|nr:hypothetical protein [Bifidobacterium xylocopae]
MGKKTTLRIIVTDQTGAEASAALENTAALTVKDLALTMRLFNDSDAINAISLTEDV